MASASVMALRMRRTILAGAATALALALDHGVHTRPVPHRHPTGFASEEDAFAAAEATYRAYVDALNAWTAQTRCPSETFTRVYDR